jgi:spore coat protein U-like protein
MTIQIRRSPLRPLAVWVTAAMLGALGAGPAVAATAVTTMPVSLTIAASCVTTAATLAFGSTGVLAASVYQTSTINVTCTNSTPYNIGLDVGAHALSTQRNMIGPALATVSYNLWRDSGHLQAWGVAVGVDTVGATGNGASQPTTVYGEVIAQTTPAPGAYADIVNVTVTY